MATIVLSAVGAAVGGAAGGSLLGMSAALVGRAVGATVGKAIDQRLMGAGSEVIEQGHVDRLRLTGASVGTAIADVHGRIRVSGHVIWASNFRENRSTSRAGGGKGGGSSTKVKTYSYSVNVAIALCNGTISHVGRIWADGREIDRSMVTLREYTGSQTQLPDPTISAIEGAENTPAYRGTAYVVLENLDLTAYGNRLPQFSFEVVRPDVKSPDTTVLPMVEAVQAVALIPGTGEYSLATTPVHYADGPGRKTTANGHAPEAQTDFLASIDALETELPNCRSVSLVVSWFGDDLRCGAATIKPKVEHKESEGAPMAWRVSGEDRLSAGQVVRDANNVPIYGGTPTDQSVVEAIRELNDRDQKVVFYPFILMEQSDGNDLPDPWSGDLGQPVLPWRGRITTSLAPGLVGSPDGTAAAEAEVSAFFGSASAADFTITGSSVTYHGPSDWGMRRFILHYAALCAAAGGVDAFCIGSEMRALTQIRGAGNSFPAVSELQNLAAEVRALLGSNTKIGYAADWSEYFGYTPDDASGDHFFHLDPLWADANIDFVGIDNYMPLSDWRDDGADQADGDWGSIYNLEYLKANIAGGEGFDWFYADEADAKAQIRTPISDGAYGEPWVFRYKDLASWWGEPHYNRIAGVRSAVPTSWQPRSKPIWFTELGCAAVDKATNEPNKFVDPKSSESRLPKASNGARDDFIQMQYLRAMYDYWSEETNNPVSPEYGGPMVDMSHAHVWAWDSRPYPWFPGLGDVWDDGENYAKGHWLNGRTGARLLSTVVREVCAKSGLTDIDTGGLSGLVRGYVDTSPGSARQCLEPLMVALGFEAYERDGKVVFNSRGHTLAKPLSDEALAVHPEQDAVMLNIRAGDAELAGRVRLSYVAADGSYEIESTEAIYPGREDMAVSASELNLVLTKGESRKVTDRWLAESRVARDTVKFALPPSKACHGPGDLVEMLEDGQPVQFRIDRAENMGAVLVDAVRVEPKIYNAAPVTEETRTIEAPSIALPVTPVFLDIPPLSDETSLQSPYVAVVAKPWPGDVAVYSAPSDSDYQFNTLVELPAAVGVTQSAMERADPGRVDRGPALRVRMSTGTLSSIPRNSLLAGANAMAIGSGVGGDWEIFQFEVADLVANDVYDLSLRLRGQLGTDGVMPDVWPEGSTVVLLDSALGRLDLPASARGLERHYRIGASGLSYDQPSFVHEVQSFAGVGLRPYKPSHLRMTRDALDHGFDWVRRTRIDGDIWSLPEVPLGENVEAYAVRVRKNGQIVRETTVANSAWSYTQAMRVQDATITGYEIEVAQISDRFGPGPFERMEINE